MWVSTESCSRQINKRKGVGGKKSVMEEEEERHVNKRERANEDKLSGIRRGRVVELSDGCKSHYGL